MRRRPSVVQLVLSAITLVVLVIVVVANHTGAPRTEVAWLSGIASGTLISVLVVLALEQWSAHRRT
ncbi:MAG: hypothetical protein JWM76_1572 [Pseudonocardiales bacterium]|nr:hypothetical protein [Pseudonocardiales bacterium]